VIYEATARVLHAEHPGRDMALVVLDAPDISAAAQPGQFVMVRCGDLTLKRPLSIHMAFDGRLALLFRITGSGTGWLSALEVGADICVTGPLGHGYTIPASSNRSLLIAGGMGIAPLYFLAARMPDPHQATIVYGSRCGDELYWTPDALRALMPQVARVDDVEMLTATDDGSAGVRGSALGVALPLLERAEHVYLCGPIGMCRAANDYLLVDDITTGSREVACSSRTRERLAAAEVSLEVRMGCGVGACYACSISTRTGRRKVCTDGPVFRFGDVHWEEVRT
jgi:dihydroorotate dehydrogenase electron transfer subunit